MSGTRGEPATTSRARGVNAELSPEVGFCELVPGVRAHNDGVRAREDNCDGVPSEAAVIATASESGGGHENVPKCRVEWGYSRQ